MLYAENIFGCKDSLIGLVTVNPKPYSSFSFTPDSNCGVPVNIQFANLSTIGTFSNWSISNGYTSTNFDPSFTFNTPGNYNIELISTNNYGCKDTSYDELNIYPEPIASFSVTPNIGCEEFTPIITNNSTNGVYYSWTMGDGGVSYDQTPIYTYNEDGIYSISLIVEGLGGCIDTMSQNNIVTVLPSPIADFNYTPNDNPSFYGWVQFNNLSIDAVLWNWDFDDNTTSISENPNHQFNANGVYNVELIAIATNGCTDTIVKPINPTYFDGLFVPNAFAPDKGNSGEMYRVFYPQGKSMTSYHVWVYDTFGILIWESTALVNGSPSEWWDGTRDGNPLPSDVYIWKVEATFENGDMWPGQSNPDQGLKRITGNVTLIR